MPATPLQTDLHPPAFQVQVHPIHLPRTLDSKQERVVPMQFVVPFFHPPRFPLASSSANHYFPGRTSFRDLTVNSLRRGVFRSVNELVEAI